MLLECRHYVDKRHSETLKAAAKDALETLEGIVYWHEQGSGHIDESWFDAAKANAINLKAALRKASP